jgi:mannitol/fructose-specific phosphotransferase system IIA component (Ntr-type)
MKIWKRLRAEHIFLDVVLPDKDMVLHFAADAFARDGVVKNAATLYDGMKAREGIMSTGIGGGMGIPHTSSSEAKDAAALLVRLADPIDFEALDGLPVDVVMALVIPENKMTLHLRILAAISRLRRNPEFCRAVRQVQEPDKLLEEIKNLEEEMAFH